MMLRIRSYRPKISARSTVAVLGLFCLGGCASQVEVDAEFPRPLIEQLPLTVGIVLDETLTEYEHHEDIPEQITWTIRLGAANRVMLEQLLGTLFMTVPVDAIPTADTQSEHDGVIKPELERFEFEVPVRGRDNFAEVWMQYRLKLYEPDGDLIVDWPVSGYGKSEIMRDREGSLNEAAVVALREVGAAIATQFPSQPEVEYWLRERQNQVQVADSSFLIPTEDTGLVNEDSTTGTNDD
ncbi:MAG: hypothetical protein OEQ25_12730 [Gammaproteobacteria bacterium]|nr:hypothetical protein [Gammaproteobacteria bacterium]